MRGMNPRVDGVIAFGLALLGTACSGSIEGSAGEAAGSAGFDPGPAFGKVEVGAVTEPGPLYLLARVDGQVDLYAWRPDSGQPPERITSTVCDELEVTSTADGSDVAWCDSNGHLWLRSAGQSRRLTDDDQDHLVLHPALAPDGSALVAALRADRRRDDTDLVHVALDPAAADRLGPAWRRGPSEGWSVIDALSGQFSPAWTPDGSQLVHTILHSKWTGQVIAEAWLTDVGFSRTRQLTLRGGLIEQPDVAFDGSRYVLTIDTGGAEGWDVLERRLDSGEERVLAGGPGRQHSPAYSPDGRSVVLLSSALRTGAVVQVDLDDPSRVTELRPFGDDPVEIVAIEW